MERIREVVKINGRPVSISDNLSKSDFQTGDIVIISFHKSHFEGVVDFSREKEATSNCSSGQRCRVSVSPASSSSQIAPMPVGLDSSVETKLSGTPPAVSTSCSSVPSQNVLPRKRPRSHSPAETCGKGKSERPQT